MEVVQEYLPLIPGDLDPLDSLKERIKALCAVTHGPKVLATVGSFVGLYQLPSYRQPVLVNSTGGVSTELKIALRLGHYESIGQDVVTLNLKDFLTRGAKPLLFLDYVAFSTLDGERMEILLRGLVWVRREVGGVLIGGGTGQVRGVYCGDDFALVGFVLEVVERDDLLDAGSVGVQ